MNTEIFNVIHDITGFNDTIDAVVVFCAKYLIYLIVAAAVGVIAYSAYKKQWRPIIFLIANFVVTFGLAFIAAQLYPSDRPFVVNSSVKTLIQHVADQSFPSTHTTIAIALALGLVFFTRFKGVGLLAIIATGVIGLSRIAAGLHWPLDILGALSAGLVASILVGIVYRITRPNTSAVQFTNHKN